MKNNDFLTLRMKLSIKVLLRTAIFCVGFSILFFMFIDWIFQDTLASIAYQFSPKFYYFCVSNKSLIVLICFAFLLMGAIYYSVLQMSKYIESMINSIYHIVNHKEDSIVLPNDLKSIEIILNEIKLESLKNEQIAKDAEQKKNDLIVYMAHDLKTPLTSIIGYLTLLKEENEISKSLQEKYIGIALDKSNRLESLINGFFEITRFNLHTIELQKENINISLMLEQVIDECYLMLEDKHLKCNFDNEKDIFMDVDSNQLARVFDNLLKNAINYSYENTEIVIQLKETTQNVEILFKNCGKEIPPYKLEKIFEKFYRLDDSRSTTTGGAGLGLAISKQIVELHQGTIQAISNKEFTQFIVTLPKEKKTC